MMISICPRDYGLTTLLFEADPSSDLRSATRRMTRTATLDGGVAITDGGWSDGDRTLSITIPQRAATPAMAAAIETLKRNHLRVSVATDEGVFEALLQRYRLSPAFSLTLAITARLSE